jgi:hypothetical protein
MSANYSLATLVAISIGSFAACTTGADSPDDKVLTTARSFEDRLAAAIAIRDVAAGAGINNGALLAGIAQSETNLVHCWRDARWACQGPASPSCDGGPVIAGSADGPCWKQQGGLGMFQFDAGTYNATLNAYGSDILTLEGNISQAVDWHG